MTTGTPAPGYDGKRTAEQEAEDQRLAEDAVAMLRRVASSKNPQMLRWHRSDGNYRPLNNAHDLALGLIAIGWDLTEQQANAVIDQVVEEGDLAVAHAVSTLRRAGLL
jgi:hypothetical protein